MGSSKSVSYSNSRNEKENQERQHNKSRKLTGCMFRRENALVKHHIAISFIVYTVGYT